MLGDGPLPIIIFRREGYHGALRLSPAICVMSPLSLSTDLDRAENGDQDEDGIMVHNPVPR